MSLWHDAATCLLQAMQRLHTTLAQMGFTVLQCCTTHAHQFFSLLSPSEAVLFVSSTYVSRTMPCAQGSMGSGCSSYGCSSTSHCSTTEGKPLCYAW
jgi:hypothetical protein